MLTLHSPRDISLRIAHNVRQQRLDRNLTQEDLSSRSGVPLGTLRVFERSGRISLDGLVKIGLSMGLEDSLLRLLEPGDSTNLFKPETKASKRLRATGRKGQTREQGG